ncbi:MAG: WD40 repeat domain-containing protein [Candidatus Endonucleobacter bathymodioli]|uniref:WD40 repeat domain-containing protein n=1 Tax=Candidatus Endonucleibacter bathymodioli TaxID=539814 RepID=A0AA90NN86_9GAMM|nr:WD40 repeat domain-containing protein [Candidatus Endonucleobacter bathymodioli]
MVTTGNDDTIKVWANTDGKWIEESTIFTDGAASSACFSPDSKHILCTVDSCVIKIYSLGVDKKWKENCTIEYATRSRAVFSADSYHLATYSKDYIQVMSLDADGGWLRQETITTEGEVQSVYFTDDSSYLVIVDCPTKVLCLGKSGEWVEKASTPSGNMLLTATAWNDDLYIVVGKTSGEHTAAIVLSLGVDGQWIEKATISANIIHSVSVGVNGIHIVTTGEDEARAQIWSLGTNMVLKEKDILKDRKDHDNEGNIKKSDAIHKKVYKVIFSNDCRHLAVIYDDDTVIICSRNEVGEWIEKTIIMNERAVSLVDFSRDGTHMSISCCFINEILLGENGGKDHFVIRLKTFRVWNLMMNGDWLEEISLSSSCDYANSIDFSFDGFNMVVGCPNGSVSVWGQKEGGNAWGEKACATFSTKGVKKVVFSPDGSHVLSISDDHLIKLFELKAVNPPPLSTLSTLSTLSSLPSSGPCQGPHIWITDVMCLDDFNDT